MKEAFGNKGGNCRSYSNPEQCRNNKACTYCRQNHKFKEAEEDGVGEGDSTRQGEEAEVSGS